MAERLADKVDGQTGEAFGRTYQADGPTEYTDGQTDQACSWANRPGRRAYRIHIWANRPGSCANRPDRRAYKIQIGTIRPGSWTNRPGSWTNRPGRRANRIHLRANRPGRQTSVIQTEGQTDCRADNAWMHGDKEILRTKSGVQFSPYYIIFTFLPFPVNINGSLRSPIEDI